MSQISSRLVIDTHGLGGRGTETRVQPSVHSTICCRVWTSCSCQVGFRAPVFFLLMCRAWNKCQLSIFWFHHGLVKIAPLLSCAVSASDTQVVSHEHHEKISAALLLLVGLNERTWSRVALLINLILFLGFTPPPSSSKLRFIFPRLISSFSVLIAKCFVLKLTDNFEHSRNPLWKGWYRPLIGPLFILYQDQRLLHSQHVHKPLMTLSSPEGPCDAVRRSTSAERLLLQVIIMMKTMLL